jgi:RecA/RadA recombinase
MAAKKTQAKTKTAKPRLSAPKAPKSAGFEPAEAGDGEDGEEEHQRVGARISADQLGIAKDVRTANREFAAAMNKDGRKRVVMANEAPNVYELRRPTGIIKLDADLGGGFPAGGLSIISGPDNAGKSFLLMRTMAMHQRLYGQYANIAYAQAEGAFDFKRALQVGLVVPVPDEILSAWHQERLQYGMPGLHPDEIRWYKREVGGFEIIQGSTGEEFLHTVNQAVIYNRFNIIGVDSFSILLPEADEHKDVGATPKMSGNANLLTDFLKKYTPHTSGINGLNPTTVLGIAQVRSNSAKASAPSYMQKMLKDWAVTGAYALRHGKLIDLTIWDGQVLRHTVQGQTVVYGKTLHWKTEKGKVGCHDNITGEVEFRYDIPMAYDDAWGIITHGLAKGVIAETPQGIDIYNPVTRAKTDLGGMPRLADLHEYMRTNFEYELHLRYYVLKALGVECLYRPLA